MFKTPDFIKNLKPYVPGKSIEELQREFGLTDIYKIASNENPLGPSPRAIEAMKNLINEIHRYPDVGAIDLREKIGKKFNVPLKNIAVGSGSESIMANILRCFLCEGDEIITSEATFIGFQVLAMGRNNVTHYVPMSRETYKFDLDAILNKINKNTKIIYLCNPNNPTGTIITKSEFNEFYAKVPKDVIILFDEAYLEYVKTGSLPLNVIPPPVDNLIAFSDSQGGINLSWQEPKSREHIAGYYIYKDNILIENLQYKNSVTWITDFTDEESPDNQSHKFEVCSYTFSGVTSSKSSINWK